MTRGRVLVTDPGDGQGRSSVAAVRALTRAGYLPTVMSSGPFPLSAASRASAGRVDVPPAGAPGYAEAINAFLASGYLTVFPASDAAIVALETPGHELVDKEIMIKRAEAAGIAVPPTEVYGSREQLLAAGPGLDYPVVVKPPLRRRVGGPSAVLVRSVEELARWPDDAALVQAHIDETIHAVAGVVWGGRIVAASHQRYLRTWPPAAGPSSAAVTVAPNGDVEERLTRLLEGFEGIFQAQFAGQYLIDLNPRVYGSLPLAVSAGANLPGLYADLVSGCPPPDQVIRARPGHHYRWIEGDVRSLLAHVRTGNLSVPAALRQLLPKRHASHSTESLTDPGPVLTRLRYAMGRHR